MKSIPNKVIPVLLSILGLIVGYILAHPVLFEVCSRTYTTPGYVGCLDKTIDLIGFPFVAFFLFAIPISVVALVVNKNTFAKWLRFSLWWVPFSLFCIYISPTTDHQTFVIIEMSHAITAQFFGLLYAWISFWIFFLNSKMYSKINNIIVRFWFAFTALYIPVAYVSLPLTSDYIYFGLEGISFGGKFYPFTLYTGLHFFIGLYVFIISVIFLLWLSRRLPSKNSKKNAP